MRGITWIWRFCFSAMFCLPGFLYAQEEESAEITTELVEDAFQDHFFEALKQKGIGNLDKALDHLSECRKLEGDVGVVDYEMGRIYAVMRQYLPAEEHLLIALRSEPGNFWYLNELVQLYLDQEDPGKAIDLVTGYRAQGWEQELLLADLYIRSNDFTRAEALLNQLEYPDEAYTAVAGLKLRLIDQRSAMAEVKTQSEAGEGETDTELTSLTQFKKALEALTKSKSYDELLLVSSEAVSNFPAQPEFYYFRALALLKTGDAAAALEASQEGMAYLLDDNQLELAFYQLMKEAYGVLGDDKKQKEIENKIGQKGF